MLRWIKQLFARPVGINYSQRTVDTVTNVANGFVEHFTVAESGNSVQVFDRTNACVVTVLISTKFAHVCIRPGIAAIIHEKSCIVPIANQDFIQWKVWEHCAKYIQAKETR